jgi:hypothetical protein
MAPHNLYIAPDPPAPSLDRKVLRRSSSVRKASRRPRALMTIALCVPWDGFLFGRRRVYPTRSRVLPSRWDHGNQMGVERQWRLASTDGVHHPDETVESLDPAGIIVRIAPSFQGRQIREGGHRGGSKRLTNRLPNLSPLLVASKPHIRSYCCNLHILLLCAAAVKPRFTS